MGGGEASAYVLNWKEIITNRARRGRVTEIGEMARSSFVAEFALRTRLFLRLTQILRVLFRMRK